MILRVARHTDDLEAIKAFYVGVLGMNILGDFQDHDGYDGLFLAYPDADWHLEFTTSKAAADHNFDEDDLLVFYPKTKAQYDEILEKIERENVTKSTPKNSYWQRHGVLIKDPDGYGVVISDLKLV